MLDTASSRTGDSFFRSSDTAQWKQSVNAQIALQAAATPSAVAIVDAAGTLSYGELERRSNRLARHLAGSLRGAGPDACVGLLLDRSADFIVAALAVMKSGAAYLPLDPSTPAERVAFILGDAKTPVLLTQKDKTAALPAGAWRVVDLDGPDSAAIDAQSDEPMDRLPSPNDLAYVIYTSGSTGRPKGVEITHANLTNLVSWHIAAFEVTARDRASQVAGLGFDAAGWEIWPALAAGARLHFADEITRRSPQALCDWLVAEKITISFVPTVLAEQLLQASWPAETALRTMLTGADTLHRRPPAGAPFALVNNYGPTECTVVATSGVVALDAAGTDCESPPSIGRPIANTAAFILDDALNPVASGEPGELCLAGAHVGRGYRNNPQLTAAKFVMYTSSGGSPVRIYRTGDRAKLLPNGEIAFLGRLDDQVKIRGYRIEPGEIVACLDRYPGVEASAVAVREEAGEPALVAYVVARHDARLTAADLREHLAARLPDYMVPARYVAMASLPLTPNGKLDKAALPAPAPGNLLASGVVEVAEAGSNLERSIGEMVAGLLGRPAVAKDANFFMLGGHSMLGAQLVARVRDSFGVKLTLRQLFTSPTVMALAAEVARLMGVDQ